MRFFALFLFLGFSFPVFGQIGTLEDDIRRAEEQSRREQQENKEKDDSTASSNEDNIFFDIFWELFKLIWVTNNTTTTYNEYPHSDDGFVKWAEWDTRYPDEWIARTTGVKDHWYSFEFQPQYLQDIGWGGGVTLRGHFWRFIGPYLEAWSLTDGTDFQGGARFGLLLALFQSEGFNLSVYGQGNFWFGAVERGGGTVGLELRSYPFRPVTLMGRAGFQLFSAFNIGEAEAQLGLMLGATEVFAGWRYWHLQTTGGSPVAAYSGPFGGLRWYF